ncbi:MAG TPA: hypothetical protein PKY87_15345 [Terricaulis sp.]|nr:hypothetical protein [Terricaulis sp.]
MQIRSMVFGLVLALGACGAPQPSAVEPAPTPPPAETAFTAEAAPAFVGEWAAGADLCVEPAWRFDARELSTLGEVHCAFSEIARSGDGYAIKAMCTAEGPPAPYDLGIALSDGGRAMTLSGGPWGDPPMQLALCGPLR